MSPTIRRLSLAVTVAFVSWSAAADLPKDSPFSPASEASAGTATADSLEFAGVSSVGSKTMVNLYDKEAKRGFWVEEGKTANGVTVVKYDLAHDQVTIRRNGVEKVLGLRAPSAVVNGPVTPPISAIPISGANTAATPGPTTPPAPTTPLSQARQEEEARMLVSDLLEIGMVQRRAYEEAQRKAAAGQNAQPTPPPGPVSPQPSQTAGAAAQAAQPAPANPSGN